jgi:hypothetical protein
VYWLLLMLLPVDLIFLVLISLCKLSLQRTLRPTFTDLEELLELVALEHALLSTLLSKSSSFKTLSTTLELFSRKLVFLNLNKSLRLLPVTLLET